MSSKGWLEVCLGGEWGIKAHAEFTCYLCVSTKFCIIPSAVHAQTRRRFNMLHWPKNLRRPQAGQRPIVGLVRQVLKAHLHVRGLGLFVLLQKQKSKMTVCGNALDFFFAEHSDFLESPLVVWQPKIVIVSLHYFS